MATMASQSTTQVASRRSRFGASVRERLSGAALPALSLLALLIAWTVASLLLSARFVPSPWSTAEELVDLFRQGLVFENLGVTLLRVALGFLLALAMGVTIGTVMGLYRRGEQFLELGVMVALTIPSLCYIIVFFMWLGLNELATVLAIAVTTFPVIAVNVWSGVKAIDNRLVDMARVFGAPQQTRMVRVVLPQILPYVMAAARYGFGVVWKVTVFVELMGRSNGVGYQLNYSFQVFDMPAVFAWTLLFTLVMLAIELLVFKPLELRLFRWRPALRA
jgi:NitT/TauT family transport system permease protein